MHDMGGKKVPLLWYSCIPPQYYS